MRIPAIASGLILSAFLAAAPIEAATPVNQAKGSYTQVRPIAASNGDGFFVAWSQDDTVNPPDLIGQPVRDDGTRLDDQKIALSHSPRTDTRDIAFGGSLYLAVWNDDRGLAGAFILPSGQLLSTFLIRADAFSVDGAAVAWDGHRFFVVWSEDGRIRGSFVSTDGTVTESRQLSDSPPNETRPQRSPDVAWNGSHFLIGWSSYIGGSVDTTADPAIDAYVRLIAADGTPVGDALHLQSNVTRLKIASNNVDFYVVMQNQRTITATGIRVEGGMLTRDATAATIFDWDLASNVSTNVTFDGADYVIALQYQIFDTSWLATKRVHTAGAPYRQRVTAIEAIGNFGEPAIASNAAGDILLATSFTDPQVEFPHVYTYLESALEDMPPPPPAPTNLAVRPHGLGYEIVSWSGTANDRGYVIEGRDRDAVLFSYLTTAPAGSTSAIVFAAAFDGPLVDVRVRAIGAGGISEPATVTVGVTVPGIGRRRAAGGH